VFLAVRDLAYTELPFQNCELLHLVRYKIMIVFFARDLL